MYNDENKGSLIGGDIGQSEFDWIPKPVVTDQSDIEGQKTNIQNGKLWPYVKNIKAYHCPSDKRLEEDDGPYLSYSLVGGLNGQDRYEEEKRNYRVATNIDQIKFPEEKIVFAEEDAEFGWNPRSWQIYDPQDLTQWTWQDPIAIRHNGRSAFGFADGHVERYKWQDERTIAMSQPPAESGAMTGHTVGHVEQPDNPDLLYMKKAYTWLPK
jgi:prepilin-type processing-associated H-X9-DG protein